MDSGKDNNFLPLTVDGTKVYVGLMRRLAAFLLDVSIIIAILVIIIQSGLYPLGIDYRVYAPTIVIFLLTFYLIYKLVLTIFFGATLGKFIVGIRVRGVDGSSVRWLRVLRRSLVEVILLVMFSFIFWVFLERDFIYAWGGGVIPYLAWIESLSIFIGISFLIWIIINLVVLFRNKQRRAFHDIVGSTVVIKKRFIK